MAALAAPSKADGQKGENSIGLIADAQYADVPNQGSRHYRASLGKLEDAVRKFNGSDFQLCIHMDGLIDRGWGNFTAPLPALSKLRLLFLDTNDISTYAHPPGSPTHTTTQDRLTKLRKEKKPNAHPWNGAVSNTRLKWLSSECTKAEKSAQHVVVSTRHPVYPSGSHNVWNTPEILSVIDRHSNIIAWFNDHNHAGTYARRNGVHYATLHGMVETADTNASAIASFSDSALSIQGAGWEPPRTLSFPS
ncbi:MAG: hypothetical protein P8J87_16370 [Verrucomicrobiales bacterium]|nr:hypothetical protein [Verrucomicrobiales bacterium]